MCVCGGLCRPCEGCAYKHPHTPSPPRLAPQGIPSVARAVITEDDSAAARKAAAARVAAAGGGAASAAAAKSYKLLVEGYDLLAVMGTQGVKVRCGARGGLGPGAALAQRGVTRTPAGPALACRRG